MKELMVFEGNNVEMVSDDNKLLFELYSTGIALGQVKYAKGIAYPRKDRIDENVKNAGITLVVHNGQRYLTEETLYDLMLEMKTDKVKPFRKWVTSEVLPTIRKTGSYSVIQDSYLIDDPIKRAERWIEEKKHTLALEQKVAEQKPKADYYDELVDREHLTGIRDTAKELHIKERVFINWLLDNKYLYRDAKNILKPYSTKMDLFTEKDFKNKNNKHSGVRTLITLKGKDFFRKACSSLKVDA